MAYLAEARRGGAPKGPVSVRWLRTTFSAVKRVLKFHMLAHRVDWNRVERLISQEARKEKREPSGGGRYDGRLHGGKSRDGGFDMAGNRRGRRGSGEWNGIPSLEVPPWESEWCRWG